VAVRVRFQPHGAAPTIARTCFRRYI
jgi:hypothetical protein